MSRGQLILLQAPVLAEHEACPCVGELGALSESQVAHELSEGFVQPEVVPPFHRHQVAEPHVGELVKNRVGSGLKLSGSRASTEYVGIAEGYAACVLHCASVVFRNEDLIVLCEGVGDAVLLLEESEALAGRVDDAISVEVLDQRRARVHTQINRATVRGHQ